MNFLPPEFPELAQARQMAAPYLLQGQLLGIQRRLNRNHKLCGFPIRNVGEHAALLQRIMRVRGLGAVDCRKSQRRPRDPAGQGKLTLKQLQLLPNRSPAWMSIQLLSYSLKPNLYFSAGVTVPQLIT